METDNVLLYSILALQAVVAVGVLTLLERLNAFVRILVDLKREGHDPLEEYRNG